MMAHSEYVDNAAIFSGGAKKSNKTKAPKEPKPTKPVKAAKAKKDGGALVDDIKSLAVPFAILLAKEGLETMFKKKNNSKSKSAVGGMSKPIGTMDGGGNCSMRKSGGGKTVGGSSCGSCSVKPMGGATAASQRERYTQLSDEIDKFLSKY